MSADLEALSREIAATSDAVRLAIAAVKANPPLNPLPWREDDSVVRSANSNAVAQWAEWADAAHLAAAVNAAPVLLAEVDRLRAQLAAAREAVAKWHSSYHDNLCYAEWPKSANPPHGGECNCGSFDNNRNRLAARRALGLEK